MKKMLLIALSLCMGLTSMLNNHHANASTSQDDDIMDYVVSGSGTFEDPYVFADVVDNPYLEMFNEHVISTIKSENDSARHQFTASLTGGSRTNQTRGGKWIYSSGGGSVLTNGVFVYSKINYVNENDTENTYVAMTNSSYLSIIKNTLSTAGISALKSTLITNGCAVGIATAVEVFFSVIPIASIANQTTINQLASAVVNNNGSLVVSYKHSYNGSWYTANATVEWDTYPTAYLPGADYGIGTYTSR